MRCLKPLLLWLLAAALGLPLSAVGQAQESAILSKKKSRDQVFQDELYGLFDNKYFNQHQTQLRIHAPNMGKQASTAFEAIAEITSHSYRGKRANRKQTITGMSVYTLSPDRLPLAMSSYDNKGLAHYKSYQYTTDHQLISTFNKYWRYTSLRTFHYTNGRLDSTVTVSRNRYVSVAKYSYDLDGNITHVGTYSRKHASTPFRLDGEEVREWRGDTLVLFTKTYPNKKPPYIQSITKRYTTGTDTVVDMRYNWSGNNRRMKYQKHVTGADGLLKRWEFMASRKNKYNAIQDYTYDIPNNKKTTTTYDHRGRLKATSQSTITHACDVAANKKNQEGTTSNEKGQPVGTYRMQYDASQDCKRRVDERFDNKQRITMQVITELSPEDLPLRIIHKNKKGEVTNTLTYSYKLFSY
jgi:hypothetical protein